MSTKQTQKTKRCCSAVLVGVLLAALSAGCSNPAGGNKPSPDTPQSQTEIPNTYATSNLDDLDSYLRNNPPAADGIYYITLTFTDADLNNNFRDLRGILKSPANKDKKIALTLKGFTSVVWWALRDCIGLVSVTIPDGVTSIGTEFFFGCTSLTSVTIPNSVTSIDRYAFFGCTSLTSVTIPDSVTSIGKWVFSGCTSLTSITIPDSVTTIGDFAFSRCTALTSITIPDSVTSIGEGVFSGCAELTQLIVSPRNMIFCSESNIIYTKNMKTLVCAAGSLSNVTIPNSVMFIRKRAFSGCKRLTRITIPDSVTTIGEGAFYNCTSLTSITIPTGVKAIGYSAFYGCTALTSVTIPNSVTSIANGAFKNCSALQGTLTLPQNLQTIGTGAFKNCNKVERFDFTSCTTQLTQIAHDAFDGCGSAVKYKVTTASGLKQKLIAIGIPESQIEETAG